MKTILFREDKNLLEEIESAKKYFKVINYRSQVSNEDEIIIGRYSVLPYYKELEKDITNLGSCLINSFTQHLYIANFYYYDDVKDYTFETFFHADELSTNNAYVVKGRTNSRKFQWNSLMFAKNKQDAIKISCDLLNDPLIAQQGVIFRKYVPLETFEIGINDMPMTNEWRLFFYQDKLIDYGYYWSTLDDTAIIDEVKKDFTKNGLVFANKIAKIISKKNNFFVLDIAKTIFGEWILVEVNDAQMSGLCTINNENFYKNLQKIL